MEIVGGRRTYVVVAVHPDGKGYYAPKSVNAHDVQTGLPLRSEAYDAQGKPDRAFRMDGFEAQPQADRRGLRS
ncbi:MAG: hypothetical protein M5R36_05315 [Deltaproteobacteria bacterium]|nr:hypothetical protein [Deltaproteobacteria bacterium]